MVYIEIDTQSQVPIYAQIMDQIRALIHDGALPVDSKLPSVRQLAGDLEINPNTVAKAYSLLERDRGTLVAPSAVAIAHKTVGSRVEEAVDRVLEETAGLGVDLDDLVKALEHRGRAARKKNPKGGSK
jgi:GntR family transcriptional regulator